MSTILEELSNFKQGLKNKDAVKQSAFAAKLFANVEGFDFAAAYEGQDEMALANHISSIAAKGEAAETDAAAVKQMLSEIGTELDIDFTAQASSDGEGKADVKAALQDKANRQAIAIAAAAGIDPEEAGAERPSDSAGATLLEQYEAMEPGAARIRFAAEHKQELAESFVYSR